MSLFFSKLNKVVSVLVHSEKNDTPVLPGSCEEVACFYPDNIISCKYLQNTKVSLWFDNWINGDLSVLKNIHLNYLYTM